MTSATRETLSMLLFGLLVKAFVSWLGIVLYDTVYVQEILWDVASWFDFWRQCAQGEIPYVDFPRQYPVGAGLLYWMMTPAMALAEGNRDGMFLIHASLASLMDVVNAVIMYCILRRIDPRAALPLAMIFVALPTSLVLSPARFESYVVTTVLLGYWCHIRDRPLAAAFFWSIGCWLKWFPAFFVAAQEVRAIVAQKKRWQWALVTGVFVAVALALNLPFLLASLGASGNIENWLYPYRFHAGRGVSGDTILGVATLWFGELAASQYSGTWTLALVAAAVVFKPAMRFEYRCMLICIAMVLVNRVYSPQFNMWFLPFAIIAAAREGPHDRRFLIGLVMAIEITNVVIYPFAYVLAREELGAFLPMAAMVRGGLWTFVFSQGVVIRGVLLGLLAAFALSSKSDGFDVGSSKLGTGLAGKVPSYA